MPAENLISFFMLYAKPVAAISRILDRGRLWFAVAIALSVSVLLSLPAQTREAEARANAFRAAQHAPTSAANHADNVDNDAYENFVPARNALGNPLHTPAGIALSSFYALAGYSSGWLAPLLALAFAFVPSIISFRAVSGFGSFGVLMRSDYVSLLMCTLCGWAAAYLPIALIQLALPQSPVFLFVASAAYFVVLVGLSIRTMTGSGIGQAIGFAAAGWVAALIGLALFDVTGSVRYYLLSPFFLFYGYSLLRNDVSALGDGLRSRQSLRRQLEIAATNPRDADAHYQLGLIYQKRRQYSEAISRFEKAVAIDANEGDAHLQLGRIALEQNRLDDAVKFLERSVAIDEKLSSSEGLRDLGAAYSKVGRTQEAAALLQKYTDRRPYDPEGLYYLGKVLAALGETNAARERFNECLEAVNTAPPHRRAQIRKWSGEAKTALKNLR